MNNLFNFDENAILLRSLMWSRNEHTKRENKLLLLQSFKTAVYKVKEGFGELLVLQVTKIDFD